MGIYRERADRRRRTRGAGEARGDGWQRTEEDERLLRLATRYSTLTLHQAAYACWGGRIEAARRRVPGCCTGTRTCAGPGRSCGRPSVARGSPAPGWVPRGRRASGCCTDLRE